MAMGVGIDWAGIAKAQTEALQQRTAADTLRAQAQANLLRTQATQLPIETAAAAELNRQRASSEALTGPASARATDMSGLAAMQNIAPNTPTPYGLTPPAPQMTAAPLPRRRSPSTPFLLDEDQANYRQSPSGLSLGRGYAKGIARVPGKGDGKKDTVPAKLAPGEAVLNKSAADRMGRGLIAALNQMGAQKMGLV